MLANLKWTNVKSRRLRKELCGALLRPSGPTGKGSWPAPSPQAGETPGPATHVQGLSLQKSEDRWFQFLPNLPWHDLTILNLCGIYCYGHKNKLFFHIVDQLPVRLSIHFSFSLVIDPFLNHPLSYCL